MADDEFTPEEIADFEDVLKDPETLKKIERLHKWRGQKESRENLKPTTPPSPAVSPPGSGLDLSLKQLREILSEKQNRSILKSLLAELDLLESPPDPKSPKPSPSPAPKPSAPSRKWI